MQIANDVGDCESASHEAITFMPNTVVNEFSHMTAYAAFPILA